MYTVTRNGHLIIVMLCIPCLMLVSPFTDQHLCPVLCKLDRILIIAPARFVVN